MSVRYYPVPQALEKLSLTRHAILEASAGTGKTYSIEHLVVALLLETPAKLDDILIVTFTERATAELRARIRGKITHVLEAATDARPAGRAWALDEGGEAKLLRALSGFDAAPIFTIHGFCKRVLADQAFFSGQLFEQELVDAAAAFERTFRAVLRSDCTPEVSPVRARLLSLFLRDAGADALSKLLFDAHRKRGVFEPAWDADAWAAGTRDQDDDTVLADFQRGPLTLQSAIVQEFGPLLQERLEREKAAQGRMDYDDMLARLHKQLTDPSSGAALAATLRAQYTYALIDEFQDTDPQQWAIFRSIFIDGSESSGPPAGDDRGRARTIANGEPAPSAQQPTTDYNRRPPSAVRQQLFLIGDPKQAIYSFRGADVQTYVDATKALRKIGADEAPISENYRSSREMIDAYNAILSTDLSDDPHQQPATDNRQPAAGPHQRPATDNRQPAVPFFTGGITYDPMVRRGEPAPVVRGGGDRPPVIMLHDVASNGDAGTGYVNRRLAQRIAEEIKDLITRPDPLVIEEKGEARTVGAGDVFILTRSNSESVMVARQLRRAGVPYAFYKQDGLFQTFEAADIRDALAAVAEPADAALRMRAWASPFFGVPWGELAAYRDAPGNHPLFADLLAWHELAKRERFHELFERMLNDSGLIRREIFFEASERARTNYEHIFEVLLQAVSERRCSLAELVRLLTRWMAALEAPGGEDGNVQRLETEKDAVQIMTIHRSKGLEAAVVFLFGGLGKPKNNKDAVAVYHRPGGRESVRHIYVGSRASDARATNPLAAEVHTLVTAEAEQEFQRLYYVGLTRAKARLYLPLLGAGCTVDGPYACVHDRLRVIAGDLAAAPGTHRIAHGYPWRGEARAEQRTADFEVCSYDLASGGSTGSTGSINATWSPEPDLLTLESTAPRAADIKATLGRLRVESFTSLRGAQTRREDSQGGEDETHGEPIARAADELPPGTSTGIFLHQALETLDPATFAGPPDLDAWLLAHPAEHLKIDRLCEAFAVAREHRRHAYTLLYRAFTTPLALGAAPLPGMHAAEHLARETDFVIPLPEAGHPPLGAWSGRVAVHAGYLKGYIDVLFAHEGKIYFADWKSNLLDDYGPANVRQYTERAYGLQGVLYTLGLVRLFGLNEQTYAERFGGYAYLYLRGLDATGNGLYVNRASWAELEVFNERLAGALLPSPILGGSDYDRVDPVYGYALPVWGPGGLMTFTPYGTVKRSFESNVPPAERFVESLRPGCARLDLGEELLFMVDDLAARSGLAGREREALTLLLLVSLATVRSGSTRLPLADSAAEPWLRAQLAMLLTAGTGWTLEEALPALRALAQKSPAPLFGPAAAYVPFHFDGTHLYHQRLRHLERGLAARLGAFDALPPVAHEKIAAAFRAVTVEAPPLLTQGGRTEPMRLDPEQQYALLAAASHRLCIISGGPGTGKTTIVVGILRMLVRLGVDPARIALAAPTGKAAYRMGEAIGGALAALPPVAADAPLREAALAPKTLHRLLGYSPAAERFRHDERNPLACDALVIDEASMIDLHLMDRLLRALPAGARLILLGDSHQLPSVDAGAVLRDLIVAKTPAYDAALAALVTPALDAALVREKIAGAGPGTVVLRKAHRAQAGTNLDAAARAVNDGDRARLAGLLARREVNAIAFADVEWADQARLAPALLRRWYESRIAAGTRPEEFLQAYDVAADGAALAALFARQTARVLCVTRVGPNGAVAVNERLHGLHRRFLGAFGDPAFLPGEPVLMLANDYDKNLFNGDQGLVLRVRAGAGEPHLAAVFARGDAYVAYALSTLGGAIEHGYALTVHKSQGSEYPHVAVVLPPEPMPLVTREILYTALTRARQSALIVGAEAVLTHAVANPEQRFTGLAV